MDQAPPISLAPSMAGTLFGRQASDGRIRSSRWILVCGFVHGVWWVFHGVCLHVLRQLPPWYTGEVGHEKRHVFLVTERVETDFPLGTPALRRNGAAVAAGSATGCAVLSRWRWRSTAVDHEGVAGGLARAFLEVGLSWENCLKLLHTSQVTAVLSVKWPGE